jgi:hypothetical protein
MKRLPHAIPLVALLILAVPVYGHNAICDCYLNEDATITCEGGFSDGGTATGIPLRVIDRDGRILIDGKMNERSEFTFDKPAVMFRVEFDAGEGHIVRIDGRDIEE